LALPNAALCADPTKTPPAGSEEAKSAPSSDITSFNDAVKDLEKQEAEAPKTRGGGQYGMPQGNYGQFNPGQMPGQMPNSPMPDQGGADMASVINGVWQVQLSSYSGSNVTQITWHYDPQRNTLSDGASEMQAYFQGNVLHASGNTSYGATMVLQFQFISPREAVGYGMV
jgi:hypothetical protein